MNFIKMFQELFRSKSKKNDGPIAVSVIDKVHKKTLGYGNYKPEGPKNGYTYPSDIRK